MNRLITIILLLGLPAQSATWYLNDEASGANNGTSWTDAWESTGDIVWGGAGVVAGDTLYVSGGTAGGTNVYESNFVVGTSGAYENPILLSVSSDAGHNGFVKFKDTLGLINRQFIKVDGRDDPDYVYPKGYQLTNIVENSRLQFTITNLVEPDYALYLNGTAGISNEFYGVTFGPVGVDIDDDNDAAHAIYLHNLDSIDGLIFEGIVITGARNDGVNQNAVVGTTVKDFDNAIFRNIWATETGDDIFQWTSPGFTLLDSLIGTPGSTNGAQHPTIDHGHPDSIQFSEGDSSYAKIGNNIILPKRNSFIKGETRVNEGSTFGPFMIFGNIFHIPENFYFNQSGDATIGEGVTIAAWRENTNASVVQAYGTNLNFMHNTMVRNSVSSNIPFNYGRANPDSGTASAWRIDVYDSIVANNIGIDQRFNNVGTASSWSIGSSAGAQGDPGEGDAYTNGFFYTTNEVLWNANVIAVDDTGSTKFTYHGTLYNDGESLGRGNVSTLPTLLSIADDNFKLDGRDTVARGQGYDTSSYTNDFPEYMTDLWGNPRFVDGSTDIGAHSVSGEYEGLEMWIPFDEAPADDDDGYDDYSGSGNHMMHLGYGNAHTASNRVPAQITWTNPVTGDIETGVEMGFHYDGWDEYDYTADHLYWTNQNTALRNAENMSVFFWGKFNDWGEGTNWNHVANRSYVTAGYGYVGAWGIRQTGQQWPDLRLYTNNDAASDYKIRMAPTDFIDTDGAVQGGSDWGHMGFTFDGSTGTFKTYFNGALIHERQVTNAVTGAPMGMLTVRGPAGGTNSGGIMIGGDTHNANPYLVIPAGGAGDDGDGTFFEDTGAKQVPNHGWMHGQMDELMIFSRTLSTNEVNSLYNGTLINQSSGAGGEGGEGGEGGGGSASGGRRGKPQSGILSGGGMF